MYEDKKYNNIKLRFWKQSFTIVEPINMGETLFLEMNLTEKMKVDILEFVDKVVNKSIEFGEKKMRETIKKNLGIE